MIYIVEIPQERPPSCWTADDEADFCMVLDHEFYRRDDKPRRGASFNEWRNYLARDLYALHVFMDDARPLAALDDGTFSGHQGAAARAALRRALIDNGAIEGDGDDH